jgi:hypothetical protein
MSEHKIRRRPPEAKVAVVRDPYTLVLNVGSSDGVAVGQRYLIYAVGPEVMDPDTGESLGKLEVVRGTGKVTHLQERLATIASDMKGAPGRTIRKQGQGGSFSPIAAALYGQREVEEILPPEAEPFDEPERGDLARPV